MRNEPHCRKYKAGRFVFLCLWKAPLDKSLVPLPNLQGPSHDQLVGVPKPSTKDQCVSLQSKDTAGWNLREGYAEKSLSVGEEPHLHIPQGARPQSQTQDLICS